MTKHIVKGEARNLGRFGAVRQGDILHMTDAETAYLQMNPTPGLSAWDGKESLSPLEKVKPEDEKKRKAELAAQNNPGLTRITELNSKTKEELITECQKLKERKISVNFRPDMERDELIQAVIAAEKG